MRLSLGCAPESRSVAILVQETIEYDFGSAEHHGITRDIPVRLHYDAEHDRLYPLGVLSVTASPGTPAQYQIENVAGGVKRIRIGDAGRTISGEHTYTIRYRVGGVLNGFSDYDELYWNAVGPDWDVPIERVTVRVTLPGAVTRVACFAGPTASRLPCAGSTVAGSVATFVEPSLLAHEAVSVVVAFPTGLIPPPVPILQQR